MLGENGWLTRRLNYMKLCKKKLATGAVNVSIDNPIEEPLSNPECDLEWLKTHSIDKNDREGIVKKLNSTRELRKEMLKITETDLREQFSFFLVAPELVSIYHIQFKTCNLNFALFLISCCGTMRSNSQQHHTMDSLMNGIDSDLYFVNIVIFLLT